MPRARAAAPSGDDREIALRSLRAIVAALSRSARSIEGRTGFTNAQLFLLRQLSAAGTLSVNELAERARTTQGTVSSVLTRLVNAGMVSRSRSSDDARRVDLSLTPHARRMLKRAPTPPTEALFEALASLDDRDARRLAGGLAALMLRLGLDPEDAPMLFEDAPKRNRARG